jgi:hypothetical protein
MKGRAVLGGGRTSSGMRSGSTGSKRPDENEPIVSAQQQSGRHRHRGRVGNTAGVVTITMARWSRTTKTMTILKNKMIKMTVPLTSIASTTPAMTMHIGMMSVFIKSRALSESLCSYNRRLRWLRGDCQG